MHRQTDRQTDRQNDYCNPRCACAPRVNEDTLTTRDIQSTCAQLSVSQLLIRVQLEVRTAITVSAQVLTHAEVANESIPNKLTECAI